MFLNLIFKCLFIYALFNFLKNQIVISFLFSRQNFAIGKLIYLQVDSRVYGRINNL